MIELPHRDWVTLDVVGSRQVLVHHGVGERCQLPFQAKLEFTSEGVGFVNAVDPGDNVEPSWVSLLGKRFA